MSTLRRLLFCLIILCMGFGASMVNLLVPDITVKSFSKTPNDCDDPMSAACEAADGKATSAMSLANAAKSIVAVVLSPVAGALSDSFGRSKFFVAGSVVVLLSYVALLANILGHVTLLPFFVLSSFTGITVPVFLCMVADENAPENRAVAFGIVLASWEVSMILVPPILEIMSVEHATSLCVLSSGIATVCAIAYGETLPVSQRVPIGQNGAEWRPDRAMKVLATTPLYRRLSCMVAGSSMAIAGVGQCFLLYLEAMYALTEADAGMFTGVMALSGLVVQALILPGLMKTMTVTKVLALGMAFQTMQNAVLFVFKSLPAVMVFSVVSGFGSITLPCVLAIQTNAVPETMLGRVQGAISALQNLAQGCGPLIYGSAFDMLLSLQRPYPQGVFGISILLLLPLVPVACSLGRYMPALSTAPVPEVRELSVALAEQGVLEVSAPAKDRT